MKLILENWNKFLREQEINEATEQEIEYLNDALEIPVSELPFGNIFGDSYRIIEPLNSLDETSSFGVAMKALEKMGWTVGSPKNGKILCSKTKVSHYIDGKGNQGVSRKTVSLNLPKVLAGIVNFVKNTRSKIATAAGDQITTSVKRYFDNIEQEEAKYDAPVGIKAKMTANEYRTAYKFFDTQNYWTGDVGDQKMAADLSKFFKSKNINFESFENFAKYASDSFDDLLANMDQYVQKNYIIYSRHPIDVFRMSDHQGIKSCHSLPSDKGEMGFDEYNKCALSEAYGNGMIAYIVPAKNFKMFPPTQESLDKVADQEIFYDEKRPDAGELVPTSRIRVKHVAYHSGPDDNQPIRVAVPQGKVYGPKVPGFIDAVGNKMASTQKQEINNIIKAASKIYGEGHVQMNGFTRYGGSYEDRGYSVAQTIPALFRKVSKDVEFHGLSVRYEPDVEEALLASIGQNSAEMIRQRLNEIFDEYTGGFISFDWEVEQGYDDIPGFTWNMHVKFRINAPSDASMTNIRNNVSDAVDYHFPDYYGFPVSDNIFVEKNREGNWMVKILYAGYDLDRSAGYLDGLEEALPEIIKKFDAFDYYYDDGPIQLIEFNLEEAGIIKSERFALRDVLKAYDLPDDSWWPEDERETEELDFFGGEVISFIAFQDENSINISEIMESVPQNLKSQALEHIAEFINMIVSSDELTGKLALNQSTWDVNRDPNVVITITSPERKLSAENLVDVEDIDFKVGVSMYSDFSREILNKTGDYLKNNASVDDLVERIQAQLKTYLENKLKGQQTIKENRRRVRIHVRR